MAKHMVVLPFELAKPLINPQITDTVTVTSINRKLKQSHQNQLLNKRFPDDFAPRQKKVNDFFIDTAAEETITRIPYFKAKHAIDSATPESPRGRTFVKTPHPVRDRSPPPTVYQVLERNDAIFRNKNNQYLFKYPGGNASKSLVDPSIEWALHGEGRMPVGVNIFAKWVHNLGIDKRRYCEKFGAMVDSIGRTTRSWIAVS
jgi:hypothetical protein